MHTLAPLIKDLAMILGVSSLVIILFQKIKQPVVLGYLIAGIILGPFTPIVFIHDTPNIKILSELGVIFLMFSLGLDFNFHKLKRVGLSASITGLIEVILMLGIGMTAGKWIGWSFHQSLFFGAALAISSTTIIIKALEELGLRHKNFAETIFGILIIEDLLAILLLVGLSTVVTTDNIFSISMLWSITKLILVVGSWFLIGYFFVPWIFHKIKYYVNEETLIVVAIALCLSLVYIADEFNYSTALGAFIMGSILAETPLVHRIEHLLKPIRDIFAAVFFVSIGMLIDPKIIFTHLSLILTICAVTIIGKVLVTGLASLLTGQTITTSTRIGFSMAQVGEFSFIIVGLGLALHATNELLYSIIVAVSAITAFTTPYLIRISAPIGEKLEQNLPISLKHIFDNYVATIYKISTPTKKKKFYGRSLFRLLVNSVLVATLFILSSYWLSPKLNEIITILWLTKIISWLIALVLTAPFIWGMLISFRDTVSYSDKYRLISAPAPYIFSWTITIIEIFVLSILYFDNITVMTLVLAMTGILFALLYKQIDKAYQWFEKRLTINLQPPLQQTRYEELAPWNTCLRELEIPRYSLLIGNTLKELQLRERFNINIVAIYRGTMTILGPKSHQILFPFDKIIFLGSEQQIEEFIQQYFTLNYEYEEPKDLLESLSMKIITIKNFKHWIGKSISEITTQETFKILVVGIERKGKEILNPKSSTLLDTDDILYIVGETDNLAQVNNNI